jgi:redox-sensing transcriptional repressor
LFDTDPQKIGHSIREIPIFHMDELEYFVKENNIDIAALTLPKQDAKEVADRLVALGIKGIWNFAQTDLEVPAHVAMENVHLSDNLYALTFHMNRK